MLPCEREGAERFVVLGDVFETGKRIEQTATAIWEEEESSDNL